VVDYRRYSVDRNFWRGGYALGAVQQAEQLLWGCFCGLPANWRAGLRLPRRGLPFEGSHFYPCRHYWTPKAYLVRQAWDSMTQTGLPGCFGASNPNHIYAALGGGLGRAAKRVA